MRPQLLSLILMSSVPAAAQESKPSAPAAKTEDGAKHVDAAGAKKLLDESAAKKDGSVVVLDVRSPDEYKGGHIAGAVNVDFQDDKFEKEVAKLDKKKTYVVHCQGGGRSSRSLETLKKLGFKNIVHLDGGLSGWKKASLPVTK